MEGISHRGISHGGNQLWRESVIEEISHGGNQLWRESVMEGISYGGNQSWESVMEGISDSGIPGMEGISQVVPRQLDISHEGKPVNGDISQRGESAMVGISHGDISHGGASVIVRNQSWWGISQRGESVMEEYQSWGYQSWGYQS